MPYSFCHTYNHVRKISAVENGTTYHVWAVTTSANAKATIIRHLDDLASMTGQFCSVDSPNYDVLKRVESPLNILRWATEIAKKLWYHATHDDRLSTGTIVQVNHVVVVHLVTQLYDACRLHGTVPSVHLWLWMTCQYLKDYTDVTGCPRATPMTTAPHGCEVDSGAPGS